MTQLLPENKAARVRFPECPHCGRRPVLRKVPGSEVEVDDGRGGKISTPKYELLPCCHARIVKPAAGPGRKARIRAQAAQSLRDRTREEEVGE